MSVERAFFVLSLTNAVIGEVENGRVVSDSSTRQPGRDVRVQNLRQNRRPRKVDADNEVRFL